MSSDPLFLCCQSSVAGTSRFGIHSHARRYSNLAIPSSLKLLACVHCGDLAHQCDGCSPPISLVADILAHMPMLPPTTRPYLHPHLSPTTRPYSRPHAHTPHPCLHSAPMLNTNAPLTTPASTQHLRHPSHNLDTVIHPPHHNVYR